MISPPVCPNLLQKVTRSPAFAFQKKNTAIIATAPSPTPAPPTVFATAPPVLEASVAEALLVPVLVLPLAAVPVNIVVGTLVLAAARVSEETVDVVFHMNTLGCDVTTAGMDVTTAGMDVATLGMPVMMPTEFVSVVYEVKGLV